MFFLSYWPFTNISLLKIEVLRIFALIETFSIHVIFTKSKFCSSVCVHLCLSIYFSLIGYFLSSGLSFCVIHMHNWLSINTVMLVTVVEQLTLMK